MNTLFCIYAVNNKVKQCKDILQKQKMLLNYNLIFTKMVNNKQKLNLEIIKIIFDKIDKDFYHYLESIYENNHLELLDYILSKNKLTRGTIINELYELVSCSGDYPDKIGIIGVYLKYYGDINQEFESCLVKYTLLIAACSNYIQLDVIKYIVEDCKADINICTKTNTALSKAVSRNKIEPIKYLIKQGAIINMPNIIYDIDVVTVEDYDDGSCFYGECDENCNHSIDWNYINKKRITSFNVITILIDNGVDFNNLRYSGGYHLEYCNSDIIEYLNQKGYCTDDNDIRKLLVFLYAYDTYQMQEYFDINLLNIVFRFIRSKNYYLKKN